MVRSATGISATPRILTLLRWPAVADLRVDAAKERAAEYGVPKGCSVEELLADPEIELVLNITSHSAHAKVAMAVVEAG